MIDSDKTKGGNMVIDEIGRNLIEEGSWIENIQIEVFSDRILIEKINKIIRTKIGIRKELYDVMDGFKQFLKIPNTYIKLQKYVNNGVFLKDALIDVFQSDYLPSIEKIHATRLKNKISKLIHDKEIDGIVRKLWGEETELGQVYKHYCYLLLNNDRTLLYNIEEKALNNDKQIEEAILDHFKTDYVLLGKDIKDRSVFFKLVNNKSARDKYIWKDREDDIKDYIEKKLESLFKSISRYVQLENVTTQMMTKFKVNFTGKNGDRGEEFVMGYAFENGETFEEWSYRTTKEYIDMEFETTLRTILSVEPFENYIKGNKRDHHVLCKKVTKLFQLLKVENDPIILQHYCRLLLIDEFMGLTKIINNAEGNLSIAVIIAMVLYFEEAYINKAGFLTEKDRDNLYNLLGDEYTRNDLFWYSRENEIKQRINDKLKDNYVFLHLDLSIENDCGIIMENLKSELTGDNGLRLLQGYSFDYPIEKWLKKKSEEMINNKCYKFIDQNIKSKLSDYYLSSDIDAKTRFQRMEILAKEYILSNELDKIVKDTWKLKPDEDTCLVYDHYFYTLVNGRLSIKSDKKDAPKKIFISFENVLREFKNHKERGLDIKKALKESFMIDFKNYLTKGKKRMSDWNTRHQFFDLMVNENAREKFLWTKSWKDYKKEIKNSVLEAYSLLVYPKGFDSKDKVFCPKVRDIVMTIVKSKEGFKTLLSGNGGWELIMNYSFRQDIATWRDNIITNYITEKPKMVILMKDERFALRSYLKNDEKLYKYFLKIYHSYSKLDGPFISYNEEGVHTKDSFYKNRERVITIKDAINSFITYFYEWKKGTGDTVRRCEIEFREFRFESKLSTWLYRNCYNYFLRQLKNEYGKWEKDLDQLPTRKEIYKVLGVVLEHNPLVEPVIKSNKRKVVDRYLALIKIEFEKNGGLSEMPTDEEIYEALIKAPWNEFGVKPNQKLAESQYEDKIHKLEILINTVLVNYAWLYFNFKRHHFNNYEQMKKSFKELGDDWKFFNDKFVKFEISDIKEISQQLSNREIPVLPKLIAFCHIQYCIYLNNDNDYKKLMNFYGMNYDLMRRWKSKSETEIKSKVWPFIDKYEVKFKKYKDNIPELYFNLLPAFFSIISFLFVENDERDSLNMNKKSLLKNESQSDADVLLDELESMYAKRDSITEWRNCYERLEKRLKDRKNNLKRMRNLALSEMRKANK